MQKDYYCPRQAREYCYSLIKHKYFLLLTLCLALCSCGFHLRSINSIPQALRTLYIASSNNYAPATKLLRSELRQSGFKMVHNPQQARYTLKIINELFNTNQPSTLFAGSVQFMTVTLYYNVTFTIVDDNNHAVIPVNTVSASSTMTASANQMLGSSNEELLIKQELVREVVNQIINQLYRSQ